MAGRKRKVVGTSPYFQQSVKKSTTEKVSRRKRQLDDEESDDDFQPDMELPPPEPAKKRRRVTRSAPGIDASEPGNSIAACSDVPPPRGRKGKRARAPQIQDLAAVEKSAPATDCTVVAGSLPAVQVPASADHHEEEEEEDSDDDDVDWEDVPGTQGDEEVTALLSGLVPVKNDASKCIAVDIDVERGRKRRTSKKDQLDKLLDKMMRETQRQKHKVHLLCLVAHARHLSSTCNEDLLKALALSQLPEEFMNRTEWPRREIGNFLAWYSSTFSMEQAVQTPSFQVARLLVAFHSKTFASHSDYVLGLVSSLRALQLSARVLLSLQPVDLKWSPSASKLASSSPTASGSDIAAIAVKPRSLPSFPAVCSGTSVLNVPSAAQGPGSESADRPSLAQSPAAVQTTGQSSSEGPSHTALGNGDASSSHQDVAPASDKSCPSKSSASKSRKRRKLKCVTATRCTQSSSRSNSPSPVKNDDTVSSASQTKPSQRQRRSCRLSDKNDRDESDNHLNKPVKSARRARKTTGKRKKLEDLDTSPSEESDVSRGDASDSDFLPPTQSMRSSQKSSPSTSLASTKSRQKKATGGTQHITRSSCASSDSESDFEPLRKKLKRNFSSPNHVLSNLAQQPTSQVSGTSCAGSRKTSPKQKSPTVSRRLSASRRGSSKETSGVDFWLEVFVAEEKSWICVDPVTLEPAAAYHIADKASQPLCYVLAVDNAGRVKDVTQRYARDWMTRAKRRRVDTKWWQEVMSAYAPLEQDIDIEEDLCLQAELESQPMPLSVQDFKGHPLYVLRRHLLKFEALHPPDVVPLGFVKSEPVYARSAVHTLHTRETWLKDARSIKDGEEPYKMVKARPKRSTPAHERGKIFSGTFGFWQTEQYVPPTAVDGKVPRNEYGNVELFKPSMLPFGCRHIQDIPNLPRIARKLGIDCVEAMVGWDQHSGYPHPIFDGVVVCEEFADTLLDAWEADRAEGERKAEEKREKRVLDRWYKLTKGLLIQQRVRSMFSIVKASSADDDDDESAGADDSDQPVDEEEDSDCGIAWSALQPDASLLPGHRLPT